MELFKYDESGKHKLRLRKCPICKQDKYMRTGRKSCSIECSANARLGKDNPAYFPPKFKGTMTEYKRYHKRVRDRRGSATGRPCESCGSTANTQWANQTGKFELPSDYKIMCAKCHAAFDRGHRVGAL